MRQVQSSHPEAGQASRPLTLRDQLSLSILWFSLNFQSAGLLPIVIPTQLLLLVSPGAAGNVQQATFLGWMSAGGALVATIVPPIVGTLSDNTTGPFGRRRPYIAVGTVLLLAGVWGLATGRSLPLFTLGFIFFQLGSNICVAGYQSLLPDRVRQSQRGEASAYFGLMTILGNIGSLALAAILLQSTATGATAADIITHGAGQFYLLTSIIMVVSVFVTIFWVAEAPFSGEADDDAARDTGKRSMVARLREWIEPWQHANFVWVFLTRSFVMLGLTLFLTFIEYYFANVAHISNFVQATAIVALLALLGAVASAFLAGVLSDRVGRVGLVCLSTACMAAAALAFVVSDNLPLWPLGIVFGVGYGAYTSVDWALAVDALPSLETVGRDMGIWGIASSLPSVAAPLLGSVVLALAGARGAVALGYRLVFALAAAFLLLGTIFVLRVRQGDDQDKKPRRRRRKPRVRRPARPMVSSGWRLAADAAGGRASGFLRFWPVWERIMHHYQPVMPIPDAPYGLFQIRIAQYRGRPITLPDGTRVGRGDTIIELHLNNHRLPAVVAQTNTFQLAQMLGQELRALARWVATSTSERDGPKALFGITVLSRGAPRLGFTLRPRPKSLRTWLDGFFMTGLLALYHPQGAGRLAQGTTYGAAPAEVWMSRGALLRRYGDAESPPR